MKLVFAPELVELPLRDGSAAWVVGDGYSVATPGVVVFDVSCRNVSDGRRVVMETVSFPRALVYLSGHDDDAPMVAIDDFVAPPPHPQDGLEGVVLAGGFEFWTLPLSSGGSMRVTAQACPRIGDDLQFTVSCVGAPVLDIVLAQVPLGVVDAEVERVLLAQGRPPAECVSEWAPVQQVWPHNAASADGAGADETGAAPLR